MKKIKTSNCLAWLILLGLSNSVSAAEWSVYGYFNAIAGRMSNERIRFDNYDASLSVNKETHLNLQAQARMDEIVSLVAQWVGDTSESDTFDLQWAYLNLDLSPHHRLRVGKSLAPFYRYSESLDVSYSHPWIRPPVETYRLSSRISLNGLQYFYRRSLNAGWDLSTQIYYGGFKDSLQSLQNSAGSQLDKFSGIVAVVDNDWALIRVGYHQAKATIHMDMLEPGGDLYELLAPSEFELLNELQLIDKKGRFYGLAVEINKSNWQWLSEVTFIRLQRNILPSHRSWYSTVAYQWKPRWLIHATYSAVTSETHFNFYSSAYQSVVDEALRYAETEQHSVTCGVRHDVKSGIALKGEWQRFFLTDNHGNLYKLSEGVTQGHSDFFNVALNVVF